MSFWYEGSLATQRTLPRQWHASYNHQDRLHALGVKPQEMIHVEGSEWGDAYRKIYCVEQRQKYEYTSSVVMMMMMKYLLITISIQETIIWDFHNIPQHSL